MQSLWPVEQRGVGAKQPCWRLLHQKLLLLLLQVELLLLLLLLLLLFKLKRQQTCNAVWARLQGPRHRFYLR